MKAKNLIFRSWYYFRTGYNTYLIIPVGYVSTLITVYYLARVTRQKLQGKAAIAAI